MVTRITRESPGRLSDRPVIGGDLVDGLVPSGFGRLILMYSQSTSGSTQPGERPVTARSGDVSSTWQHSIMAHEATEEETNGVILTSSGRKERTTRVFCFPVLSSVILAYRLSIDESNKLYEYSSSQSNPTVTGTRMLYGITQCYLPPDTDDIAAFTPAEVGTRLGDIGRMQGIFYYCTVT